MKSVMNTAPFLAVVLAVLAGATQAAPLPERSPLLLLPPANRIVGVWDFQVHIFSCDTGQTLRRFRASSVFNAGGTMLDTNNTPPTSRGPAFGVWSYDPRARQHVTEMRLYRYHPDGGFAGVNQVRRTLTLSADGDGMAGEFRGQILGPNEEVLANTCGNEVGTRSL
ncbi:hypothetical protein ACFOLC_10085 [Lysobacter cavernae]|uniref:DUF1579 domain-containing protein n=1 Tax=Lysobacter cavernae TaxID=1685901 RepID=A0ABV7RQF8_9GAMM